MTTVRETRRPTAPGQTAPAERRPFRDNPRLILLGIVLLFAALAAMIFLADKSAQLNPDFLSEVLLYALSAADLTMVVALVFVLARNIVKLLVERRRGLPFSRFRAKLVLALLGLTIVPSLLVLAVGGELIRSVTQLWFSQPLDKVLRHANDIGNTYYREHEDVMADHAQRLARSIPASAVAAGNVEAVRAVIAPEVTLGGLGLVEVYRVGSAGAPTALVAVESLSVPRGHQKSVADRLAEKVASGSSDTRTLDSLDGGGELVRAGSIIRETTTNRPVGVVIASGLLSGDVATHARNINEAYENYSQLQVLRRPLQGVYLSLFLMMTLMILVSATWTGLYLAKRITRPVQLLAAGAREIGAGRLDHRIEPETRDEFGSLV